MKENRVYQMAIEVLNNEAYDMQEDYTNDEIAEAVKDIVSKLNRAKTDSVEIEMSGNMIKVHNGLHWSFVSFSTGEFTGLSESIAEITDLSRPINDDEVKGLIEMMNEAYYRAIA